MLKLKLKHYLTKIRYKLQRFKAGIVINHINLSFGKKIANIFFKNLPIFLNKIANIFLKDCQYFLKRLPIFLKRLPIF